MKGTFMNKTTLSLLGFTVLVLSACAPSLTWNRAGTSDEQISADLRSCRSEARQATTEPELTEPPIYGDAQLTLADRELSDALSDFFIMRLESIEARNENNGAADEDAELVIEFGFAESSALRAELERALEGRQVYERSASDEVGQRIDATYSRALNLLSSTPELDLSAEWSSLDEDAFNTFDEDLTTDEAINQAFDAYDDSAEDYLDAQNEPLLEPYRAELSSRTESCMLALGYQALE